MLFIQSCDDGFGDGNGLDARDQELVPPALGKFDRREERSKDVACNDESSAYGGGLVNMIEFVSK